MIDLNPIMTEETFDKSWFQFCLSPKFNHIQPEDMLGFAVGECGAPEASVTTEVLHLIQRCGIPSKHNTWAQKHLIRHGVLQERNGKLRIHGDLGLSSSEILATLRLHILLKSKSGAMNVTALCGRAARVPVVISMSSFSPKTEVPTRHVCQFSPSPRGTNLAHDVDFEIKNSLSPHLFIGVMSKYWRCSPAHTCILRAINSYCARWEPYSC
ncbi:uncharacterized protein ACNLHF_021272 [Anomaloglossus baeobatrachus]